MAKCDFLQHVQLNQQTIKEAGVNQHNQNGIAERNISTVCDQAYTMLLHTVDFLPLPYLLTSGPLPAAWP
jgi:hypothetical protein